MQRLNSLKTPWQVSPSTPFLRLLATECAGDQPTQVTFVAHFGLRGEQTPSQEIGFSGTTIAANPYKVTSEPEGESKTHSIVKIEFREGLWARFSAAFSDREVLDPREFDSSLIPYSGTPTDIGSWLCLCRMSF